MKIKDILDLGGNSLENFCVGSYGDLENANRGLGRFLFYTGSDTEKKDHLVVWDGSEFKALAFMKDVADNSEFVALKERVDLLSGDVDTDAIISNMKEVSAFLSGFAEDANLMSVLDGKLDKTGGTISGGFGALTIKRHSEHASGIKYENSNGVLGYLGFNGSEPCFWGKNLSDMQTLIHSGNIGEYAPGKTGVGASGTWDITSQRSLLLYQPKDGEQVEDVMTGEVLRGLRFVHTIPGNIEGLFPSNNYGNAMLTINRHSGGGSSQLGFSGNGNIYYRLMSATDWKTIAFTDSTVNKAKALVSDNGTAAATADDNGRLLISAMVATKTGGGVYIGPNAIGFNRNTENGQMLVSGYAGGQINVNRDNGNMIFATTTAQGAYNARMLINSSGNVTIGASDLAGSDAKLYVDGRVRSKAIGINCESDNVEAFFLMPKSNSELQFQATGGGGFFSFHTAYNGMGERMRIANNGNVGIGTTDPSEKLHVKGNLYVEGNIVATGEVSAGGSGTEGSTPSAGAGAFFAQTIDAGDKEYTIAHNLGTEDVIVTIYEWSNNDNRWSMILTDVEIVNTDRVLVSFGSNTTVDHRVVVMGAVA